MVALVAVGRRLAALPSWRPSRMLPAALSAQPAWGPRGWRAVHTSHSRHADGAEQEEKAPRQPGTAKPLQLTSEVLLYESKTDLLPAAQAARTQCLMGTTMCLCGFAGVLVGSPTAPPAAQMMVVMGAMASVYKHAFMAKKELGNIAQRHVQEVVLRPTQAAGASGSSPEAAPAVGEGTAEERLQATQQLELLVRTPNLEFKFELGEPVAPWEGAKYSGLVADERPQFNEVCKVMLHFEEATDKPDGPVVLDQELFDALQHCDKVVVEREVTIRDGLQPDDLLGVPMDTPQRMEGLVDGVGNKDSSSAANSQRAAGRGKPPLDEIKMIGRSSVMSGFIFQIAGLIFLSRLVSDGKDPTLGELYMKMKHGDAAVDAAAPK